MAKKPQDTGSRREKVVALAEQVIDQMIVESVRASIVVAADVLKISPYEWDILLKPKYIAAGWRKAELVSDQREGDFIRLEA